ncbi:hypothetical protein [Neisseria chenwenguii]|uniref:hypothetical protein n=1 Tax=Neisseria chenwenguii TaxID=1853278 RepID=UPI001E4798B6|nr:hypothetical protein [Neisseria chenwenguii]
MEKLAAIFKIDIAELITSDDKGLFLLIGANSGDNTNYYGNPEIAVELEKLKLSLKHTQELLLIKDEMLAQKNNEIEALKSLLAVLQK